MIEKYFFDISIYRCDKATWNSERDNEVYRLAERISKKDTPLDTEISAASFLIPDKESFYNGACIAILKFYVVDQSIRAELYFVKERISKKLKNKTWVYGGKQFEIDTHYYSNDKIFSLLEKRIYEYVEDRFPNRFVDLEIFRNIGKYIDFKDLTNAK